MLFRVDGADRETGEERSIVLEAKDEAEAIAVGNARGLMVAEVVAAAGSSIAKKRPAVVPPVRSRRARNSHSGVVTLVAFAVLAFLIFRPASNSSSSNSRRDSG